MKKTLLQGNMVHWLVDHNVPQNKAIEITERFFKAASDYKPKTEPKKLKIYIKLVSRTELILDCSKDWTGEAESLMKEQLKRFKDHIEFNWFWTASTKKTQDGRTIITCRAVEKKEARKKQLVNDAVDNMDMAQLEKLQAQLEDLMKNMASKK
jgi:hypothetical protein